MNGVSSVYVIVRQCFPVRRGQEVRIPQILPVVRRKGVEILGNKVDAHRLFPCC